MTFLSSSFSHRRATPSKSTSAVRCHPRPAGPRYANAAARALASKVSEDGEGKPIRRPMRHPNMPTLDLFKQSHQFQEFAKKFNAKTAKLALGGAHPLETARDEKSKKENRKLLSFPIYRRIDPRKKVKFKEDGTMERPPPHPKAVHHLAEVPWLSGLFAKKKTFRNLLRIHLWQHREEAMLHNVELRQKRVRQKWEKRRREKGDKKTFLSPSQPTDGSAGGEQQLHEEEEKEAKRRLLWVTEDLEHHRGAGAGTNPSEAPFQQMRLSVNFDNVTPNLTIEHLDFWRQHIVSPAAVWLGQSLSVQRIEGKLYLKYACKTSWTPDK